jgi:hypothetical protein
MPDRGTYQAYVVRLETRADRAAVGLR